MAEEIKDAEVIEKTEAKEEPKEEEKKPVNKAEELAYFEEMNKKLLPLMIVAGALQLLHPVLGFTGPLNAVLWPLHIVAFVGSLVLGIIGLVKDIPYLQRVTAFGKPEDLTEEEKKKATTALVYAIVALVIFIFACL